MYNKMNCKSYLLIYKKCTFFSDIGEVINRTIMINMSTEIKPKGCKKENIHTDIEHAMLQHTVVVKP